MLDFQGSIPVPNCLPDGSEAWAVDTLDGPAYLFQFASSEIPFGEVIRRKLSMSQKAVYGPRSRLLLTGGHLAR
jgi:hypothetical protein